jgi:predicted nucleic acid-binding protein
MSAGFRVIYDANILFSGFKRRVMLALARAEIFQARWSEDIHKEWMARLPERYPDKFPAEKVSKIRTLIDSHVPDCLVSGYKSLIEGLQLPDPGDRHVLAAAIKAGAQVIVTCDTAHFPKECLAEFDIEAQHPDTFVMYQKEENSVAVLARLKEARLTYTNPALTAEEFIEKFRKNEMPLTANWLESAISLLE